ncbi:GTP pyrophosphokinase family protein [Deinococcus radiodurans]|jgi:Uncharacterized protein conserved in bacteria|nr:GTP pyrophosphokinase [Deinococcus radiodurans R1 = ATCC 13939 = DSM 20539]
MGVAMSSSAPFSPSTLVADYVSQLSEYEALRSAAVAHMARLLQEAGLNIHHVTARLKKPASLADKLRRKVGRYHTLGDVTDLVGVRVITYFESDVAAVSRLVEGCCEVDWDHSIDKSKMHDPDRFGYMGVHYVVRPSASQPEFAALLDAHPGLSDLRFEIQIRSILQHAWAEIEHDLGYKNREAVPREVRRRFYRLAGLLEMADEEFMALARMSRDYAATLPERVQEEPESVFIDVQSVSYLLGQPPVRPLDLEVAEALGVTLLVDWPDPERPVRLTSLLDYVGVHSVGQLQKELARFAPDIVRFAAALLPQLREAWTPAGGARPGTSLVHYALLRACVNPSLEAREVIKMLDLMGTQSERQLVRTVRETYREVISAGTEEREG